MAYDRRLLTEGEEIITEFRPHWRLLVIPAPWFLAGIVAIVLMLQVLPDDGPWKLIVTLLVVAAWIPLVVAPLIRWWFTSYVLTNERLITRTGVLARKGIEIPLENINNVLFSQNVLERLLKTGDLLIESAGESGQSRFSDIPRPEEFQSLLYRVREERALRIAREGNQPAPVASTAGAKEDPAVRLERLDALLAAGKITSEEYAARRQAILEDL